MVFRRNVGRCELLADQIEISWGGNMRHQIAIFAHGESRGPSLSAATGAIHTQDATAIVWKL